MKKWDKESALVELAQLLSEAERLYSSYCMSPEHTRWLLKVFQFLESVFGASSIYYLSFRQLRWHYTGSFVIQAWNIQSAVEDKHHQGYLHDIGTAIGLLQAANDELFSSTIEDVYNNKNSPEEVSEIFKILTIAERKLRKTIRTIPSREKEIQDAFENLLIGSDLVYSRESETIEYSSKKYIPDFTLSSLNLAVEIKFINRDDREKEIIAEINDDILAYKLKFRNILFVIYDNGFVRDVERFSMQFEENENVMVRVIKH